MWPGEAKAFAGPIFCRSKRVTAPRTDFAARMAPLRPCIGVSLSRRGRLSRDPRCYRAPTAAQKASVVHRDRLGCAIPGERHRARAAQHDGRNRLAVRPRKAPPCRSFRAEHGRATHLTTETVRSTGTERLRCAVSAKRHWSPKRHVSVRGTVGRPAATGSLCVLESGRGPERLAITHKPSAVRPRRIPLCRFWRVAARNNRKPRFRAAAARER